MRNRCRRTESSIRRVRHDELQNDTTEGEHLAYGPAHHGHSPHRRPAGRVSWRRRQGWSSANSVQGRTSTFARWGHGRVVSCSCRGLACLARRTVITQGRRGQHNLERHTIRRATHASPLRETGQFTLVTNLPQGHVQRVPTSETTTPEPSSLTRRGNTVPKCDGPESCPQRSRC